MAPTPEELKQKIAELEEKVDANEDNQENIKEQYKKDALEAILAAMDEEDKEHVKAAMEEGDEHPIKKARSRRGKNHDEELLSNLEKEKMEAKIQQMSATIAAYEEERSTELINDLVALKSSLVPTTDEEIYRLQLSAKSFDELNEMHTERKDEIKAMTASAKDERIHFGFGLKASQNGGMTRMSDILNNGGIN